MVLISGAALLLVQPSASGQSPQEINENLKHLQGTIDDLNNSQSDLRKQIQSLSREISELREKAGKPAGNFASEDDIKRLADAIKEVDKKRQADAENVKAKLSELAKSIGTPTRPTRPDPKDKGDKGDKEKPPVSDTGTGEKGTKGDQEGFTYKVKSGDSFSIIAKMYREQGFKVYVTDIEKANPGADSKSLTVGQKLFIPVPKDKAK